MQTHWVFNDCGSNLKEQLRAYWDKKQPRLERLLTHFQGDLKHLGLTVYRHTTPYRFEVRAVLHLPTAALVAEEEQKEFTEALDRVADALCREIKRHLEALRRDHVFRRKLRRRQNLVRAGGSLERDVAQGRRHAFFALLRPLLRFLAEHARRELHVLELEGALPRGDLTTGDLVDEVLTIAWERYTRRPRRTSLDLWLVDLLHECLERWRREPPTLSLVAAGSEPRSEDQEPGEELFLESTDAITLEETLPDREQTEAWQRLEAEEQRAYLTRLLAKLPEPQRQAMLLEVLEGYDADEIALIQDRAIAEVRTDLEAARQALRCSLGESGHLETEEIGQAAGSELMREDIHQLSGQPG